MLRSAAAFFVPHSGSAPDQIRLHEYQHWSSPEFTAQTELDPHLAESYLVKLCFAREASDACTGTAATGAPGSPESASNFPAFHRNNRHRFPLSRKISNHFAAHSTHFVAYSHPFHCTFGRFHPCIALDAPAPLSMISQNAAGAPLAGIQVISEVREVTG